MGPPCPAANVNAGWAPMQPTWVGKRGWRLAVLRGVLPRTSHACYDSNYFLLSRRRSGRLPLQGTGRPASAVSRGAPLPTANRKPGMAVVSHCSPAAPRRALFNVAAPFRPAALAMGRPCPAVNAGRAPMQPTWVAKRGWRLAVLRGVAVVGGRAAPFFSLSPVAPGHCEMGDLRQCPGARLEQGAASLTTRGRSKRPGAGDPGWGSGASTGHKDQRSRHFC